MKNKILSVKNLKKNFHDKHLEIEALKDISFDVYEKEFISIVGPSGCGKSTILSILSGLENPSSGNFKYSKDVTIGYMLQNDSLFPWRTILDNCLIGLEINNNLTKENKEYVINLLNTYGLGDFLDKYPSNLSGGMRQRVALIRTLATKPDILLLDEAMSALDYQSRLAISDDIYRIIKNEGKTVIMVTHDIGEAISMSDRIIVISKRPGVVKNIYDIDLDNKSTPINNRKSKNFNYYFDKIWRDLDVHI
ncbi:MAG: ABC transporter ATP-binding protein [Firmicutes bacterium]|nr:ABC transporter ATP-binding protein [Bacillota bacterium]